jgi:hypothetical protein
MFRDGFFVRVSTHDQLQESHPRTLKKQVPAAGVG